jgi:soluble lytic murein transglycosylase-like protein
MADRVSTYFWPSGASAVAARRLLLWLFILGFQGCSREPAPPSKAEIWAAIQPAAERYGIEPAFIYALVAAESNFDPKARNGDARGLLQMKPRAWRTVSTAPYEPTVWNWRANLETGIDYLAYSRSYVHKHSSFSYPRLLAAFHYGLDYLEEREFDPDLVPIPENEIYRQLWRGNLKPVAPPE